MRDSDVTGLRSRLLQSVRRGSCLLMATLLWLPGASAQTAVEVVEYYVPSLNKYFITGRANEKALLDGNSSFTRTGMSFRAFAADSTAPVGTVPICRFYLPAPGPNTHTYLGPADCALVISSHIAGFNDEGRDFAVHLPFADGSCPAAAPNPVYRSFNRRDNVNDAGHRFVTDDASYVAMAARGFDSEGAVFCSGSVAGSTIALPGLAADAQVIAAPSGFATPAGSSPLAMRYRTLSSVIKILDSDIISSSATGFVVRGARALRAGDRVAAAGRFYKVVGVAIVTGNTSISATNPVLSEIFAEFEVTGGMDLANSSGQGAAALFSGDSAKATTALKDVVFSKSIEIKPGVTFDGKVTIPKMELIFNAPYSALGSSKPSPSAGVVMTIRGSAELEGALTVDAIGKVFFPPSAEAESAFGYQSRPGCFDVWTGGTLLMGASLPICLEAQVDAGFKTTTRSIKKITNFELIATRSASGAISWTQTFSPVDTATLGPPVDLPDSESFFTTTIGVYIAPRVVLTSFLGSLNLLSFKLRGGLEVDDSARAKPLPLCINYGLNGVMRLYYSAPLFALVAGKAADNFHEIFAVSKLITEHKGCTVVADGNFVGDVTGTTTIKNIGKCSGDYRFNYSGFFSIDAKAGSPTSMLAAFTLDETALAAVPPDCPGSYAESIIDLCTTFRVVDKAFEAVPDELLCSVYSNYKIVFDSSGSKATVTWLLNAHNNIWMGTIQGVTVAKKK